MSQVGKRPADEKMNGGLTSPSKVPKVGGSPEEERLARLKDLFSKGGPKPPPPKPKPKKPSSAPPTEITNENSPPISPGAQDPGPIILNPESLRQLSTIMEIDLDTVVRQQDILENQAQKDRAALSQSKGMQSRRLPASFASKVPEDYAARRRAQSYSTSSLVRSSVSDETDSPLRGNTPDLSEEERKQRVLSRSGLSQGSHPLAALGSILKKRNSLKGNGSPKSPKRSADSPRSTPKMKKKSLDTSDSGGFTKGLFGSLRRSGKKKNKVDSSASTTTSTNVSTEDIRADTSSIASLPIAPSPRHEEPITTSTPVKPIGTKDSNVSPPPSMEKSFKTTSYKSPVHEGPRDSTLFREASIERLFDSESSDLFGASELDAFFKKEKEKSPERSLPEEKPVQADTKAEETESKRPSRQSESMNKMLSRIHAYEKASASESISESPPLEDEGSKDKEKAAKEDNKDKEKVKEPKQEKKSKPVKFGGLFDDDQEDDLFAPPKQPKSPAKKTDQSNLDKKKDRLFEDELFREDKKPPVKKDKPPVQEPPAKKPPPKVMKKPKRSVDDSQSKEVKKEVQESPKRRAVTKETGATTVEAETKVQKPKDEKPKVEEAPSKSKQPPAEVKRESPKVKPKSPPPEVKPKSPPPEEVKPKAEQPKEEEVTKEDDKPAEKKPETSSFFDDGSELPVYGLRRKPQTSQVDAEKKEVPKTEDKPVEKKISKGLFDDDDESELPPFGLRRNRRGGDRRGRGGLFDDHDEDMPPHYGRRLQATRLTEETDGGADSLFGEVKKDVADESKKEPQETKVPEVTLEDKTKIEVESEEREKEKKDKPTKSTNLFDDDDKVEDKVADTKEEAPSKSPELQVRSPTPEEDADKEPEAAPTETKAEEEKKTEVKKPATARDRSATELGTAATGKGVGKSKEEKKEPSWMTNIKKKKEEGEKSTASPAKKRTTKTSTATKDEDVPDWQKRVLERRKNRAAAAEASKKSTTRTTAGSASPRTGRLSAKTETTTSKSGKKSPTTDRKSGRKSPVTGRKSPVTGRKSPVTGRKSPLTGRKSPVTDRKSTNKTTTERKSQLARDKEERGFSKSVEVSSTKRITNKDKDTPTSKDEKPKEETDSAVTKSVEESKPKERTLSDSTKPKPQVSRKPSIEVVTKRIRVSSTKSSRSSTLSPEPNKPAKSEETEDDVFEEGKKPTLGRVRTPSPKLSVELLSSVLDEEGNGTTSPNEPAKDGKESPNEDKEPVKDSQPSKSSTTSQDESTSSEQGRSPTPTSPTGPLKLSTDPDVPEWKKKLLEKKKREGSTSSAATKRASGTKKEPEVPAWKKELMSRKPRSATVSVPSKASPSTGRTGRRSKVEETPDFMKEFKRKQKTKE